AYGRRPKPWLHAPTTRAPEPGLGARVRRLGRLFAHRAFGLSQPTRIQWSIGVLPQWDIAMAGDLPWSQVKWLTPPEKAIVADPFLVEDGENAWLFYARLMYDNNVGTLWVAPFDVCNGTQGKAAEVLKTPFHLSFPNVFKHENEWYMLPEQARSGVTSLYRATEFPYRWEKYRDILPNFPG